MGKRDFVDRVDSVDPVGEFKELSNIFVCCFLSLTGLVNTAFLNHQRNPCILGHIIHIL